MNSLNGTDYQIKLRAIITECERTGLDPDTVCKFHTGLTEQEYTERPFNRVGFYRFEHERHNFKKPTINFWEL